MALGRKKVTLPDDPAEEPLVEDMPDEAATDAAVAEPPTDPVQDAADDAMLGALGEAPAAEAEAEASAAGTDGLLDMFTTVGVHVEDRSMLLSLAGEVDMDDLVSELGVVAAALGIVMSERGVAQHVEELAQAA